MQQGIYFYVSLVLLELFIILRIQHIACCHTKLFIGDGCSHWDNIPSLKIVILKL